MACVYFIKTAVFFPYFFGERTMLSVSSAAAACFYFISAVLFLIYCIQPSQWHILSGIQFLIGTSDVALGGTAYGYVMIFGAWIVAVSSGFYRTHQKIKFVLPLLAVAAAAAANVRYSLCSMACSFGSFIIFLITGAAFLSFLYKNFSVFSLLFSSSEHSASKLPELDLSLYKLDEKELEALCAVLNDVSYAEIGQKLALSTSTVKKMMLQLFAKFGQDSLVDFRLYMSRYSLKYPAWYTPPENAGAKIRA
jgi:DNA-binding CsgD family transcriptional regulator